MIKHLLIILLFAGILTSCASTAHNSAHENAPGRHLANNSQPVTSGFADVDTSFIVRNELSLSKAPDSLTGLPRTDEGAFVLYPGFYEASFKTYCLQPGTPGPSGNDAYFQAPLKGSRKDIIETILRNSQQQPDLEQRNIQLLLWSVVTRSDFNKLSWEVQNTARQLLTPKQVFQLSGGVIGVVKNVSQVLPSSGPQHDLFQLFDLGVSSYDAFERLAVLSTPSETRHSSFKRDQWYKQREGYYVKYLPSSYRETNIQVYVPDGVVDSLEYKNGNYIVFDPISLVVVPANSNAQQLGVGAPVRDMVKSVIHIIGSGSGPRRPKEPKVVTHHGTEM